MCMNGLNLHSSSEWDTQSGTEAGLANGTWYTPKYGDSAYSKKKI